MDVRVDRKICAILLAVALLVQAGCGSDEVEWETARDVAGARTGDRIQADQLWGVYRDGVVRGLDAMKAMLLETRRQIAVGERHRVDELNSRIATLRHDMVAELDAPSDRVSATRIRLRRSFVDLRSDVDSLLLRLGHDREEFAKWEKVDE